MCTIIMLKFKWKIKASRIGKPNDNSANLFMTIYVVTKSDREFQKDHEGLYHIFRRNFHLNIHKKKNIHISFDCRFVLSYILVLFTICFISSVSFRLGTSQYHVLTFINKAFY